MSLLDMSRESLGGVLDRLGINECRSLVRGCLPHFQEALKEKSFPLADYLVCRWNFLNQFVVGLNPFFLLVSFVSITWCDCCCQKQSHSTYQSSDEEKKWSFCLECDGEMMQGRKPGNFQWITGRDIPLELDLVGITYRYVVIDEGVLRFRADPFLDKDKLQMKMYLLKDLLDLQQHNK